MSNSSNDDERSRKRESGIPGGGAGRRDEVGGSGVYPVSAKEKPKDPNAPIKDQASWGQGARGAEGYNDSGRSEIFYMPGELKEESVADADTDSSATKLPRSEQGEQSGSGENNEPNDPNRQPGDQDLYNEDKQGGVFYDKNTEIKRESEFHDSTGAPIGKQPKVTRDTDEFGKQKK